MTPAMTPVPEFSRPIEVARLAPGGEAIALVATAGECAALARRFGLEALAELAATLSLSPGAGGVVAASGSLRARFTQRCVVTLEPFEQTLEIPVQLVFRPATAADRAADQTLDPEAEDELPYEEGWFDLGEAVAETLALALDPWPRRPGAVFEPPPEPPAAGPFAALARLGRGRGG